MIQRGLTTNESARDAYSRCAACAGMPKPTYQSGDSPEKMGPSLTTDRAGVTPLDEVAEFHLETGFEASPHVLDEGGGTT